MSWIMEDWTWQDWLWIIGALVIAIALISTAYCQEIPDTPEPQCEQAIGIEGGLVVYRVIPCGHIPKSKTWKVVYLDAPKKDGFFAFRTSAQPILHPNKKAWAIFLGVHAAAWIALATANHQKEEWSSEAPAVGVITGLDFLAFKCFSPALGIGPGIYAAVHYGMAH